MSHADNINIIWEKKVKESVDEHENPMAISLIRSGDNVKCDSELYYDVD